mmetsp:Transcript_34688/g.62978  ORF Transcript_34688/g.62978 Transcript_34688/m.62978 type:complete len:220 (+) Transcript_34688:2048-2707(+)
MPMSGATLSVRIDWHIFMFVEAALVVLASALVTKERNSKHLLQRLLFPRRQEFPGPVKHVLRWHRSPDKSGAHVACRGACLQFGVHRQPHRHGKPNIGATNVHHHQAHKPPRRRRSVQTNTARAENGGENSGSHAGNVGVDGHSVDRDSSELCNVLLVLASLSHGIGIRRCKPRPVELLVHRIVATIVAKQANADATGGGCAGRGISGCTKLHGCGRCL